MCGWIRRWVMRLSFTFAEVRTGTHVSLLSYEYLMYTPGEFVNRALSKTHCGREP